MRATSSPQRPLVRRTDRDVPRRSRHCRATCSCSANCIPSRRPGARRRRLPARHAASIPDYPQPRKRAMPRCSGSSTGRRRADRRTQREPRAHRGASSSSRRGSRPIPAPPRSAPRRPTDCSRSATMPRPIAASREAARPRGPTSTLHCAARTHRARPRSVRTRPLRRGRDRLPPAARRRRSTDPARSAVTERLQAAVYRQGEASRARRARRTRPSPTTCGSARSHPDAGTRDTGPLRRRRRARDHRPARRRGRLLDAFRTRHPGHPLAADAPRRLAGALRSGRRWTRRRRRVARRRRGRRRYRGPATGPVPRGRTCARGTRSDCALRATSRDYVEQYPRPADLHIEALDQLDQLATQPGDVAHATAGSPPRSRWSSEMRAEPGPIRTRSRALPRSPPRRSTTLASRRTRVRRGGAWSIPLAQSLERKQAGAARGADAIRGGGRLRNRRARDREHRGRSATCTPALAAALMTSERPRDCRTPNSKQYAAAARGTGVPVRGGGDRAARDQRAAQPAKAAGIRGSNAASPNCGRLVPARFDRPERRSRQPRRRRRKPRARVAGRRAVDLRRQGDFGAARSKPEPLPRLHRRTARLRSGLSQPRHSLRALSRPSRRRPSMPIVAIRRSPTEPRSARLRMDAGTSNGGGA